MPLWISYIVCTYNVRVLQAVGRPLMPPYWSLGFQLSRWDYGNLTNLQHIVERNRLRGIPQVLLFNGYFLLFKEYSFHSIFYTDLF